jgi:hypothetical protein
MREPDLSIAGWLLLDGAETLRERALARLISAMDLRSIQFVHSPEWFEIYPSSPTVRAILGSCFAHIGARETLARIPISRSPRSSIGDPELVPMLQDLAEIIAWEATQAFSADYYPGLSDVFVPDEHVELVMISLQREMDREGRSRRKIPVSFTELPRERQRALAERRRWWFQKFSITPERWGSGTWSLWDVSEEPLPEMAALVPAMAKVR